MKIDEEKRFLYLNALKHFEIHAAQRIQTLNFCVVIESLLVTGVLGLFSSKEFRIAAIIICFAISFFAVCFYLMDIRMKLMIKSSEKVLQTLEAEFGCSEKICVFRYTEFHLTEVCKKKKHLPSWAKVLRAIYFFFAILGLTGFTVFLVLFILGL